MWILVLAYDEICRGCEHGLHQQQVLVYLRHQGGHRAEQELRQARVLVPPESLLDCYLAKDIQILQCNLLYDALQGTRC